MYGCYFKIVSNVRNLNEIEKPANEKDPLLTDFSLPRKSVVCVFCNKLPLPKNKITHKHKTTAGRAERKEKKEVNSS